MTWCDAEEPARRHLDEREVVPARVGQSGRVVRGKALAERSAKRGQGERLLGQQRSRPLQHRGQVDPGEGRPHLGMGGQLSVEDGPEQRPEREAVVGRERWIVPRIEAIRTTWRSTSSVSSSAAAKPWSRDQSPDTGSPAPAPGARRAGALPTAHRAAPVEEKLPLQRRPVERPCGDRVRHGKRALRYCSPPRTEVMRCVLKPSQCMRPT